MSWIEARIEVAHADAERIRAEAVAEGDVAVRRDEPFALQHTQLLFAIRPCEGPEHDRVPARGHGKARDVGEDAGIGPRPFLALRQRRLRLDLQPDLILCHGPERQQREEETEQDRGKTHA